MGGWGKWQGKVEKGRYVHTYVDTDMTCVMDKWFKVNFEQNTQHRLKYNAGHEDMEDLVNYKYIKFAEEYALLFNR